MAQRLEQAFILCDSASDLSAITESPNRVLAFVKDEGKFYSRQGGSWVVSALGAQGPAGNDGAQGPQGTQGPQGPQGPAGLSGGSVPMKAGIVNLASGG